MSRRARWLLGWAVLTVLLVLAFRGVAWGEAIAALDGADPGPLALAVAANFLVIPLATWMWLSLLPRGASVGVSTMFRIQALTFTVSNGGPFMAGHATAIHLVATRGGVGHATAFSVKMLEQLAVGLAKLAVLGTAVLLVPVPGRWRAAAFVLVVGVPALGGVLLVGAHRARTLERWAASRSGWSEKAAGFLARAAVSLEAVRSPGALGTATILALAQRAAEGLAIWAVVAALGVQIPAWGILLVLAAVTLSTTVSVTPANLGIYEGSAVAGYVLAGVETEVALGLAVVQHLAYLVPVAGTGWVLMARRRRR